ncbi:YrbL family protein [Vibrio scophthalmi]|uniref:YrbL family protein n=1 Tax=Vibrio scophthalmi TaxID=45658 RepID=UPI003EBBA391
MKHIKNIYSICITLMYIKHLNIKMLNINHHFYLSSGEKRDVYLHPEQDDKCIKIEKTAGLKSNALEARFFKKYSDSRYIPKYFGLEDTSLGRGLIVELVRDFDGNVSKSIKDYLTDNSIDIKECRKYVTLIENEFIQKSILIHDDGLQNILLKKNSDMTYTPIMIDGFGPREWSRKTIFKVIVPFLTKKKSKQVFGKMHKRLI